LKRLRGRFRGPAILGHPTVAASVSQIQVELIQTSVLRLLLLDVSTDHRLISPDRRHDVPPPPTLFPPTPPPPLLHPPLPTRLPLHEPNYLCHRVFWPYCDQHMHVVTPHMSFLNPAFLLFCQFLEHLTQMLPQTHVQCLAPPFWDEYHMVFALPFRMT